MLSAPLLFLFYEYFVYLLPLQVCLKRSMNQVKDEVLKLFKNYNPGCITKLLENFFYLYKNWIVLKILFKETFEAKMKFTKFR